MLVVHVLVKSREDLNVTTKYNAQAGLIRFRDFEEALDMKVLQYALSTSDAAPDTQDYDLALGTAAVPPNTKSVWLKTKREGATAY